MVLALVQEYLREFGAEVCVCDGERERERGWGGGGFILALVQEYLRVEGTYQATWKRDFKFAWRKAGPS